MDMKKLAGDKAAEYVKDGMVVGLGTGSTAYHMVNAVGEMVKNGLKIQAIPTSKATEAQARELGIPLLTIDELDHVDLAIDGVDEIDPQFNAIKGGGGALVREKILAEAAEQVIWIMDAGKRVETIEDYTLPIELVPFSHPFVRRALMNWGYDATLRMQQDSAFITDNGNLILDVRIPASRSIQEAHDELVHIAGVVETGYFHIEAMCITAETTGVTIW